jgi:hypothetical protein
MPLLTQPRQLQIEKTTFKISENLQSNFRPVGLRPNQIKKGAPK